MRLTLVSCFFGFINGFLLDTKNTSVQVSPTFLTTAEYYGDKSQTQKELNILRQTMTTYHQNQQESQERTLNLLVSQIQNKLGAFEQKLLEKNVNTTIKNQSATACEHKCQELEVKYEEMRNSSEAWKQMYFELEIKFMEMNNAFITTMQDFNGMKVEYANLKDLQLAQTQEIEKLKQLKTIDQLQTINNVNQKTQELDSKISVIEKTEKARDQDFLALIQTVTDIENNTKAQKLEQLKILNTTNENIEAQLIVQNNTMKAIESKLRLELAQAQTRQSQTVTGLQTQLVQLSKQVVLMACYGHNGAYADAGLLQFDSVKTSVGVSNMWSYRFTGKFTCEESGYYFIEVTIESVDNELYIEIMVNQASQRAQYITGDTENHWTTGTTSGIFHLQTNNQVWIKNSDRKRVSHACLNIFKIK